MALENLLRADQLRTFDTNGGDNTDADQISGAALLIKLNNSAKISDFTVAGATTGAALIAMQGITGYTNVQTALVRTAEGAQCLGTFASAAALETAYPAADNTNRTAIVWGAGATLDGVYVSNGVAWTFNGALIGRAGAGPYVFDFGNKELTNIGAPLTGSSAATRQFVEALMQGLSWTYPVDYKSDIVVDTLANLPTATPYIVNTLGFATTEDTDRGVLYKVAPTIGTPAFTGTGDDTATAGGTYVGYAGSFRVRVTTGGAYGAAVVTIWFTKTGGSEVLVGTYTPADGVAFPLQNGATLTLTDGGDTNLVLNDEWVTAITVAWTAVTPTVGERLMLNGDTGIPNGINVDYVLTYSTAYHWDYDNTGTTRHTPVARETRIYKADNVAYTYVDPQTQWVISDASGGQIGTRTYTYDYNVVDLETLTDSIDRLDIAVGDRTYSIIGGLGTNIVTTAESVAASIQKLNQLGNYGVGYGTALVGHEDTSNYYTSNFLHGILEEIGAKLAAQLVKGSHNWKKGAGTDTAAGKLSFTANTKIITVVETSNFTNFTVFLGTPGSNLTWGTGTAGDYSATRSALAAGFKFEVSVNGQHWMPVQIAWDDSTKVLTISLDDNLKAGDLVSVTMTRAGKA